MGNTTVVASGVKNQGNAEASNLYHLVNLKGGGDLVETMKRARWTKNYSEVDERIKKDVQPFLYNEGEGKLISIVDLVNFRNKDRPRSRIKASKNKQKSAQNQARIDNIMMMENNQIDGILSKQDHKTRFQCWDLSKRGTVGETILHLCLLNATQTHADLAKRLLYFFPKMINDIYCGEEYYGETVLHLAIVNEDPAMVKFLLDKGADVEARVCGNFFTPDDQRESRTDVLDHEWVSLCRETNYEGNVYWGDYPLSFAACLNQEECVRLLLAKGADPNLQDTNGNTVMHMLVIYDNLKMFDLLYSQGGRLDIKNRQHLTPLTMAAKLARKDMFEHILEMVREVYWLYGNVTSAGYPLTDIDTISSSGEINMDSALHLIVQGESEGHLEMMDGLIVQLLQEKWKTFAGYRFYRRFILFIFYFIAFVISFALRPADDLCASLNDTSHLSHCSPNHTFNSCYLLTPYQNQDIARMFLEAVVLISAMVYIFLAMKEIYHQGFKIFFSTLTGAPAKTLFLLSCLFVVSMLPGRAACASQFEDIVGVLAVLCTSPYFLFFCRIGKNISQTDTKALQEVPMSTVESDADLISTCEEKGLKSSSWKMGVGSLLKQEDDDSQTPCDGRNDVNIQGFRIVGPSVVMIYHMIRKDLLQFFIIYLVFIIGFSQAMYIIFMGEEESPFEKADESIMGMIIMSLGQFGDFYDTFDDTRYPQMGKTNVFSHPLDNVLGMISMSIGDFEELYTFFSELASPFQEIIKIIFIVYMVLVTLLLVNMLIAMMGRTYEMVTNTQKEWFRQWANIVLVVEQTVTRECRREQMIKYSVPFGENERALMIRWYQTEKEREELRNLRNKNKIYQKAMASRKVSIRKTINRNELPYILAEHGQLNI